MKNNARRPLAAVALGREVSTRKAVRVSAKVRQLFKQCGYLRTPPKSPENGNVREGGHRGYEVRFMAHSRQECHKIVALLKECHIPYGKPFNKGQQWRIPVYGRGIFAALKDSH